MCRVSSVLGHLAPVHRCVGPVLCVSCAVSRATWLLFNGVLARFVVLRALCPGPLGSCSPVCWVGALCCVCGVLGHLARVYLCVRSVCCVAWSCCVCGVLGHLAPVHRYSRSVFCVTCAVSWATWLLFASALARCVVFRVRCPGPPGSCSPVCSLGALRCLYAAIWATWFLFTNVPARCVVLYVRRPGPRGSCSPVCMLGVLCSLCRVPGHLAPVHRCTPSVGCVACAVS